jgi:DedD protein
VSAEEYDEDARRGPGWLATLLGAAILLAAGFAVGIVVGAVREEPAMLLSYVTGRSASVPAPSAAKDDTGLLPPAGAPPPVEAAPRPASPMIAPAATPPAQVASGPPASPRFAVQVGAFAQSAEAARLEAALKEKGLPVYVQPATGERDSRWRVRVGPMDSREEADRVATRLKTQDKLPVWVIDENG